MYKNVCGSRCVCVRVSHFERKKHLSAFRYDCVVCVYSICIVCTSTWKCSAYESNALQTKRALFLSNTLTDVYKKGIYMLGGGLIVIPINPFLGSQSDPRIMTVTPEDPLIYLQSLDWWNKRPPNLALQIKTIHSEQVHLKIGWFRSRQCLKINHPPSNVAAEAIFSLPLILCLSFLFFLFFTVSVLSQNGCLYEICLQEKERVTSHYWWDCGLPSFSLLYTYIYTYIKIQTPKLSLCPAEIKLESLCLWG